MKKQEDAILVRCLHVMAGDPKWKGDNGTFRSWYLNQLEKCWRKNFLNQRLNLTHILSQLWDDNAICEMITTRSGLRWNDQEKMWLHQKMYLIVRLRYVLNLNSTWYNYFICIFDLNILIVIMYFFWHFVRFTHMLEDWETNSFLTLMTLSSFLGKIEPLERELKL